MENLSEGHCHCCHCCCDGGKTKSTPSLGFRLRLEFDKNNKILLSLWAMYSVAKFLAAEAAQELRKSQRNKETKKQILLSKISVARVHFVIRFSKISATEYIAHRESKKIFSILKPSPYSAVHFFLKP